MVEQLYTMSRMEAPTSRLGAAPLEPPALKKSRTWQNKLINLPRAAQFSMVNNRIDKLIKRISGSMPELLEQLKWIKKALARLNAQDLQQCQAPLIELKLAVEAVRLHKHRTGRTIRMVGFILDETFNSAPDRTQRQTYYDIRLLLDIYLMLGINPTLEDAALKFVALEEHFADFLDCVEHDKTFNRMGA